MIVIIFLLRIFLKQHTSLRYRKKVINKYKSVSVGESTPSCGYIRYRYFSLGNLLWSIIKACIFMDIYICFLHIFIYFLLQMTIYIKKVNIKSLDMTKNWKKWLKVKNITSEIGTVDNNWLFIIIITIVINKFFQNISVSHICDAVCCSKIAPCRKHGWRVTSLRILEEQYVETSITNTAARFTVSGDGARFCTVEIYRYYSQIASSRGWSVTLYPRECLNTSV